MQNSMGKNVIVPALSFSTACLYCSASVHTACGSANHPPAVMDVLTCATARNTVTTRLRQRRAGGKNADRAPRKIPLHAKRQNQGKSKLIIVAHPLFSCPVIELRYFTQRLRKAPNVSHLANNSFIYNTRGAIWRTFYAGMQVVRDKMVVLENSNAGGIAFLCSDSTYSGVAFALMITEVKKHNKLI